MDSLTRKIWEAGIVGAGGAGFPTHVKIQGDVETLIVNAVECEPLLQVDKGLLSHYASELIEGLSLIMAEKGIKKTIIGIKSHYESIIKHLEDQARSYPTIEIKPLPNVYPMGDEVVLIYETTGIALKRGVLPLDHKVMVMNVETVLNLYRALVLNLPVTHSYVTLAGQVERPGTYLLPLGTSLKEALETLAKPTSETYEVIVGGPMTGRLAKGSEVVRKTTKAFIILPKDHPLVRNMTQVDTTHLKRIMASCSQCRACTDLCPRHLMGHKVEPHKLMNAIANDMNQHSLVLPTALGCVDCGVCELYACHHDLSPRKMMVAVKKAYGLAGIRPSSEACDPVHKDRHYRQVPSKRLVMHLNLSKYDQAHPFYETPIRVREVVIPLDHHIGMPAQAVVKVGDRVRGGQLIGDNPRGKLGAKVHASIDGVVIRVQENAVTIKSQPLEGGGS